MTIERENRNGPFVIECDTCHDTDELEGEAFHEALDDARGRGFKAYPIAGGWGHRCRSCI